jgi:dTDP-4-dehydrorhamnose 3,5-epimerase
MKFAATSLAGSYVITLDRKEDNRGFFARTFCSDEFSAHGLRTHFPQCNYSFSKKKYTLRGFHYQVDGFEEAKLVRCTAGALLDVVIDLRASSITRGQYFSIELSGKNNIALYVPEGFAHSFITLEDNTEASYMVSSKYSPGSERGIRWNDPTFRIPWPTNEPIISDKDSSWPDYCL